MALTGKTAILFGAGAIATGYAPLFADHRMNIAVVSRGESCEKLAASLAGTGSNVVTVHADASNPEEVRRVFHEVAARFGTIDICVNGSGGTERAANFTDLDGFLKVEPGAIQKVLTNNYLSKVYAIQQFAAYLHQTKCANRPVDGSIINITSMSGFVPLARVAFYSQQLLDEVRNEVAVLIPPEFNRFQNSFTHIFAGGYAAGYYSYKWAEVLSADAYSLFEENGVLNLAAGLRFRDEVLAAGGSRDAMHSFIAFRGREPTIDALLRHNGLLEENQAA